MGRLTAAITRESKNVQVEKLCPPKKGHNKVAFLHQMTGKLILRRSKNYLVTFFSKTGSALITGAGAALSPPAVRSEAYGGCVST